MSSEGTTGKDAMTTRSSLFARHRRRTARSLTLLAAALVLGLTAGCASAPQGVLQVPGSFTVVLRQPTIEYPSGSPLGVVTMCLDEASAVQVTAYGRLELSWQGTTYVVEDSRPVSITTPVIPAGCGTVKVAAVCCWIPPSITVTAVKV
jgi:hypothetical protein